MPENIDAATDTADAADASPPAAEQPSGEAQKTFTQSELEKILEQRLSRERAKFADYEQIKADAAELAKIRDAEKTELQRWQERAETAEKRASEAEIVALRSKVAAQKGVPASSLTGTTEDELIASADELIAWRDQAKPAAQPAAKRPPASGLKSGATRTESINSDPKAKAAEAVRLLRSR